MFSFAFLPFDSDRAYWISVRWQWHWTIKDTVRLAFESIPEIWHIYLVWHVIHSIRWHRNSKFHGSKRSPLWRRTTSTKKPFWVWTNKDTKSIALALERIWVNFYTLFDEIDSEEKYIQFHNFLKSLNFNWMHWLLERHAIWIIRKTKLIDFDYIFEK